MSARRVCILFLRVLGVVVVPSSDPVPIWVQVPAGNERTPSNEMPWQGSSTKAKNKPRNPACNLCLSCLGAAFIGVITYGLLYKHFSPRILADATAFRDSPKSYHSARVLKSGFMEYGHGHCFGASACLCSSNKRAGSLCYKWVLEESYDGKLAHLTAKTYDGKRRRLAWLLEWSPRHTERPRKHCHAVPWLLVEFKDGNQIKRRCSYLYGTAPRSQVSRYSLAVPAAASQSGEDKARHMLNRVVNITTSPDTSVEVWVQPGTDDCVVGFGSLDSYVHEVLAAEHDFHRIGAFIETLVFAVLATVVVAVRSIFFLYKSCNAPDRVPGPSVTEPEDPEEFLRIFRSEDGPLE